MIPNDGFEYFRWDGCEADWTIAGRALAVTFLVDSPTFHSVGSFASSIDFLKSSLKGPAKTLADSRRTRGWMESDPGELDGFREASLASTLWGETSTSSSVAPSKLKGSVGRAPASSTVK